MINYQGEVVPVNAGIYPVSVVIHTTEGDVPFDVIHKSFHPNQLLLLSIFQVIYLWSEFPTNPELPVSWKCCIGSSW